MHNYDIRRYYDFSSGLFMRLLIKKITFTLIITVPIFVIFIIFFSWRNEKIFSPEIYNSGDNSRIKFSIDKCTLKNGAAYVSGWAFINSPPDKQKIIITIPRDGKYFLPVVMINNRADVSKVFNRGTELDHSGFSFSYRVDKNVEASFNINILSNGVLYSENHVCH